MFGWKKSEDNTSAVERLGARMTRIGEEARALAALVHGGAAMPAVKGDPAENGPIATSDIPGLFENRKADGTKAYDFHHYTNDLKSMDPNAQVDLMRFFGDAVALNTLIARCDRRPVADDVLESATRLLDRIAVSAFFFARFLARRDVTTMALTGSGTREDIARAMDVLRAGDRAQVAKLTLFHGDSLEKNLPQPSIPFCLFAGRQPESGEKFINGVWFPAAEGAQLLQVLAAAQARSMALSRTA